MNNQDKEPIEWRHEFDFRSTDTYLYSNQGAMFSVFSCIIAQIKSLINKIIAK